MESGHGHGVATHHVRLIRTLRWVSFGEQVGAGIALTLIFALVLIQAVQRYLPVAGWAWTSELAVYALVWLTFSMAGYLMGRGEHITLQMVDSLRSPRMLGAVRVFANVAVAVIAVGFTVEGYRLLATETGVSPAMRMPLVWLYVLPLVGFALTALRVLLALVVAGVEGPAASTGSSQKGATS